MNKNGLDLSVHKGAILSFIKTYWLEIIIFCIIGAVLIGDTANGLTWINTDSDGAHYLFASKYMLLAHDTSAPLFLLLGRLFLYLPFGTEAWRFGLLLALSTIVASVIIYKIVRYHLNDNSKARFYALIASLIYGGSALVISQSTIIDTYAFVTMLGVLAYYFAIQKKWIWVSVAIGLLWATHTLFAWMIWLPLLIQYKPLRDRVLIFITLSFLLFYAYIPIVVAVNNPPDMWNNTTIQGFFMGSGGVLTMLTGQIAIYDMPKRILDTIGILGVSLGFGFIILLFTLWKIRKTEKALLWLILVPVIYFVINLSSQTYVYLMPSIAFGAVAVALGLSKLKLRWSYVTAIVAIGLLVFNANYFDIGRTLDPNMSAMKFYNEELPKIPDGQIFLGGGWNWAMVYLYNKDNDRNIIIVSTDGLPSDKYLNKLEEQGIKFTRSQSVNGLDRQWEVALSVVESNPDVWIVKNTEPRTYGAEVVLAKGNEYLMTQWIGYEIEPEWHWTPSNPYLFISGALEVNEWDIFLRSNRNALFFIALAVAGWILNKWLWKFMSVSKRGIVNEAQEETGN